MYMLAIIGSYNNMHMYSNISLVQMKKMAIVSEDSGCRSVASESVNMAMFRLVLGMNKLVTLYDCKHTCSTTHLNTEVAEHEQLETFPLFLKCFWGALQEK